MAGCAASPQYGDLQAGIRTGVLYPRLQAPAPIYPCRYGMMGMNPQTFAPIHNYGDISL